MVDAAELLDRIEIALSLLMLAPQVDPGDVRAMVHSRAALLEAKTLLENLQP